MHLYTSGSAMENEPKENLADNFEHRPNEAATRNDLRTLATLVDSDALTKLIYNSKRMIDKVFTRKKCSRFREAMRKEMSDFRESMHRDMY
jgi:glutamine synthetase